MGNSSSTEINSFFDDSTQPSNNNSNTEVITQSVPPPVNLCDQECQSKKADKIVSVLQTNFTKSLADATQLLSGYNGLYLNMNNVNELLVKYMKENKHLKDDISNVSSDILTNDRKTYYEEQSIDSLKYFYKWMKYIYAFIVVVYLFCIFLVPSETSMKKEIFIFVLLCLYPFIILPIFRLLNIIYEKIMSYMPKNVYKTL